MSEDIEKMIELKKLIEDNAKKEIKNQTGKRVYQAMKLAKGEDVFDGDDIMDSFAASKRDERFINSFEFLRRIYWFGKGKNSIKDPAKLEEVLKIYKEVYDRTLEVLIELGEVGYIENE